MTYEKFFGDSEHFFGWRCISCGEIIDPVILANKHHFRLAARPHSFSLSKG